MTEKEKKEIDALLKIRLLFWDIDAASNDVDDDREGFFTFCIHLKRAYKAVEAMYHKEDHDYLSKRIKEIRAEMNNSHDNNSQETDLGNDAIPKGDRKVTGCRL